MGRPSSLQTSRANNGKFGYLWKNGIGCPIGTVPIKTIAKDELLKLNLFSNSYKPRGSWNFTYNKYNVDGNQHHVSGLIFVIFQNHIYTIIQTHNINIGYVYDVDD